MPVMNSIILDHFYIALPPEKFEQYDEFTKLINGRFSQVKSGKDSWEGYYTQSRSGEYLEILKDRRVDGFGIGLSPINPLYVVAKNIMDEMPESKFNMGTRLNSKGESWFDWISPVAYEDHENVVVNAWIMDVFKSHTDYQTRPTKRIIDSWDSLSGSLGEKYIPDLERAMTIVPGIKKIENNTYQYLIPRKDGFDFDLKVVIDKGEQKFKPYEIGFTLYHGANISEKLKSFPFIKSLGEQKYSLSVMLDLSF